MLNNCKELMEATAGDTAEVPGPGRCFAICLLEEVPCYHKLATANLEVGP